MPPSPASRTTFATQTSRSQPWETERLKIMQHQVGHRYQSTTAIYSGVSGDFMNTMMRKALDRAFHADEERER